MEVGRDYNQDIFSHLQETLTGIDLLKIELVQEREARRREVEALNARIEKLEKENAALRLENARLREIQNRNSGNSSKPPSSDGFTKIFNSREKTGRKPGGQPGHKGHGPKLHETPTRVVEVKAEKCRCGGDIVYSDAYRAKQLVDVVVAADVTEYREYQGKCSCCGAKTHNEAPVRDMVTYGEKLKSLVALLSVEGCVSLNRLVQIVREMTGIALSEGTVVSWLRELSEKVAPSVEALKDTLLLSSVLHKDETGLRVGGELQWLHVLCDNRHTLYLAHQKRGNDADRAMNVLPAYSGTLVHDHMKGLYDFPCTHAECNAHILRYLKAAAENQKRKWAADMIDLLMQAKSLLPGAQPGPTAKQGVTAGQTGPTAAQIEDIQARYDAILSAGRAEFQPGEDYNGEDMKLLRRMQKFKAAHLRFLTDPAVPFDNNQAERDLRMIKAKQKISGTFRAPDGGTIFATLKSYTATLRKQNLNIFNALRNAFIAQPVPLG